MIVVIETSVWISGLQFGGRLGKPLRTIEKALREHTLATCPEINSEIQRVLVEKFQWPDDDAQRLIAAYFKKAIHVNISGSLHICRDPNDDMILECAVVAEAQIIVSGDKYLLIMGSFRGIQIVTPAEFLELNP